MIEAIVRLEVEIRAVDTEIARPNKDNRWARRLIAVAVSLGSPFRVMIPEETSEKYPFSGPVQELSRTSREFFSGSR